MSSAIQEDVDERKLKSESALRRLLLQPSDNVITTENSEIEKKIFCVTDALSERLSRDFFEKQNSYFPQTASNGKRRVRILLF